MSFLDTATRDCQKLLDLYKRAFVLVKEQIADDLSFKLETYEPPQTVLTQYPFFSDRRKLVKDYLSCIGIDELSNSRFSLVVAKEQLVRLGLPENLSQLLEYGNSILPPFPHLRNIDTRLSKAIKQLLG